MLRTPCFLPKAKSCPKGNPLGHGRMSQNRLKPGTLAEIKIEIIGD